ncbi:GNAT family N-acetyltransferase [Lutimonas zeaxanthinifaciens]|uniref:GNAT family N-acetyltransferase n=1 Tax=Lutimonas zeaxanthinifaciens TaxID=3060215 RepID=UPI00265D25F9|nr:GNAT family N-acetyltransferase [Lutimonas sp. YSD2104]WKK65523.1 GNAT family N-acetyltransferase [Lutimonas sp. YSD2104]
MEIVIASKKHIKYAQIISETIDNSANQRGTGIAKRTPEYIEEKIKNGNAVIALEGEKFAGFCYIETFGGKNFVVHSGLIVHPDFRKQGLAKKIKTKVFKYSQKKFPDSKIFGITTGLAVMKINYELGYKPVTFSELTDDPEFWKGCQTCRNYDVLQRTNQKMCLCTGMLYDGKKKSKKEHPYNSKSLSRLKRIKQSLFLKKKEKNKKTD